MKFLKSLGALLVLALLLVGVPVALWALGGSPIPTSLPSGNEIASALSNPNWALLVGGILTYVGWFAWLTFAISVALEVPAALRGVTAPRLPGFGVQQRLAAMLLGAVVFTAVPQIAFAAPAGEPAGHTAVTQMLLTPLSDGGASVGTSLDDGGGQAGSSASAAAAQQSAHPGPYTVEAGDSLYAIAAKFLGDGERWPELAQLNYGVTQADGSALGASHVIETGWVLQLPDGAADPASASASTVTIEHAVVEGDTLWDIADRYLGDPYKWPDLYEATRGMVQPDGGQIVDPDLIYPGWVVSVPGVTAAQDAGSGQGSEAGSGSTSGASLDRGAEKSGPGERGAEPGAKTWSASGLDEEGAADTEASEAEEGLSVQTIGGAGSVLAAGIIGVLAYRRRETQRRRSPGMRLSMPAPHSTAAALEGQLRALADPMSLATVDRVLRVLSDHHHERGLSLPDIRAARMAPDMFEIFLGSPATLPAPWQGSADEVVWSVTAHAAAALTPSDTATAPFPTLVTVGVDESGAHVMLDMEHVSSLDIRGDAEVAHASIAALAAELATTPWADDLQVTLVGTLPELGAILDTGRIRHVPSLDRVIRELEKRADAVKRALDAAGVESIPAARGAGLIEDAWTPEVVLVGGEIPAELRGRLEALLDRVPRVGLAAITAGTSGEWALVLDENDPARAVLEPANLAVRVQQLNPQEYADILSLISGTPKVVAGPTWAENLTAREPAMAELAAAPVVAGSGSGPTTNGRVSADPAAAAASGHVPAAGYPSPVPAAAASGHVLAAGYPSPVPVTTTGAVAAEGEAASSLEIVPASGATRASAELAAAEVVQLRHPRVRVLGEVELEAPAGTELAEKDRSQALELVAYLSLTPGATNEQLSAALWPGREAKNATRNSAVSRARRWLGADHTGSPYLPIATTAENFGTYSLTHVTTDWDQFLAVVGSDASVTPTERLCAALELVRGRPFASARAGKYTWAEPHAQEMISSIVDVAHEVGRRSLLAGDAEGARWASAVGLAVTPDDERLWRNAIRAEWMLGDQQALWALVKRCYEHLDDLEVEPDAETEKLVAELRAASVRPRVGTGQL
nr:LysM peptidoglycan-binding domain-containing protein [Actinomycetales bacterium]